MLRDAGEAIQFFEPLIVPVSSRHRGPLADLALDVARRSEGFRRSLPDSIATALADLVRSMNCYYSNLIEGHDTHPVDIERALGYDYSSDPRQRNLQLEALAHIAVQKWIDNGGLNGLSPTGPEVIREIHRRFCAELPGELLVVTDPVTGEEIQVVPGMLRDRDVQVGRHVAISPGAVPRFLDRLHAVCGTSRPVDAILAAASAHHRLLWVHPFVDGNGRVARLVSHAMLLQTLGTGGLWSISRGLARQEGAYKQHLANGDLTRRNDLDGRGHLSEEMLAAFTTFFLQTCLDQIDFMEGLMQPARLRDRILIWAEEQIRAGILPKRADIALRMILHQGELSRGDTADLLGTSDRTARRITASLIKIGAVKSETSKAPLRLAFPAKFADRWMPGLFPDR